jgi:glutamate/tyrosine decarboxylase-like PLP-dependent enzyme
MTSPLDLEPDEFRRVAAAVADALATHLASLPVRGVSASPHPQDLIDAFAESLPIEGEGLDALLVTLRDRVFPLSMAIGSPRYFGQFNPSPIPIAALMELVVAILNQNAGSFLQSPVMTAIEHRTIAWLLELAGLPRTSFGQFTSGGTTATLTALKMARDKALPEVRARGARGIDREVAVYASDQCHFSIARSLDLLGLGNESLRRIASDDGYRMAPTALAAAIEADLSAGILPLAIVATAGTTPTGSLDPLAAIATIAARHEIHFHVDAAYGGAALLSPALRGKLAGIERADTITVDPHKWMMIPNEAGCLLVRDPKGLVDSFDQQPAYLADSQDRHAILPDYYRLGIQGSRRARAFKLWATLKVLGSAALATAIERHVELAQRLLARVRALPDFEVLNEPDFALFCFRHAPRGVSDEQLDENNRAIQRHVEASGEAWFATTVLRGRKVLRVNVESFRTTEDDVDRLLAAIVRAAREVS